MIGKVRKMIGRDRSNEAGWYLGNLLNTEQGRAWMERWAEETKGMNMIEYCLKINLDDR